MSGRPEILFPLFAGLETLDGVGPKTASNFAQIAISRPRDLLFTLPYSVVDRRRRPTVKGADVPGVVTVEVSVGVHHPPKVRGRPYRVQVTDAETSFQLVFFHAHAEYLQKMLPTGGRRVVSGKLEVFDGIAQMVHPDHILRPEEAAEIPAFESVYPLPS
ncbi:MAG: ATP-dependent DNA helicase RecG, partial [Halocynthiibacter sp.]